jgi:hypothetical protein
MPIRLVKEARVADKPIDWEEEGKKHALNSRQHPERPCKNYPTRDKHSAKDEADFIRGFNLQKAEFDAGRGLAGMAAYATEIEEQEDGSRKVIIKEKGA